MPYSIYSARAPKGYLIDNKLFLFSVIGVVSSKNLVLKLQFLSALQQYK